ncbi:hypothetical protein Runsl_5570 [Runella slithyformis DSM 19594]|uniref:Uncharacterized protein n=1 Tax=Runella slithyformis (strain ATCC 29530 / DSM 19594 / LMG 11500 / NCIMB 11436 / LSU 4) TaxID=761193 RepID=A0A7U3ZR60_RUNSL|nr:hypothetical protein Runsl_5570 [Runella slithyformis DSM 19594]
MKIRPFFWKVRGKNLGGAPSVLPYPCRRFLKTAPEVAHNLVFKPRRRRCSPHPIKKGLSQKSETVPRKIEMSRWSGYSALFLKIVIVGYFTFTNCLNDLLATVNSNEYSPEGK